MNRRKPPSLDHVKWVERRGKWYGYFNTGQKNDGKPIRKRLPPWGEVGFFESYAGFMAGRTKRANAKTYTVKDLIADYLASSKYKDLAQATRSNYATQLGKFERNLGHFPANEIAPPDVRHLLEIADWGAGTKNMVIASIGALYRWGRKNSKVTAEPIKDIDRLQGGSHDPWPEDVLEAALVSTDDRVRLAVHLLYFTGLRINDALKLRWSEISKGAITTTPQKTSRFGKVVHIPLAEELKVELDRTPRKGLRIMEGFAYRKTRDLLQSFTKAMGVETVPHGLRKNAVIALLEAGCTIGEVMAITGQTMQVVEHYAAQVNRKRMSGAAIVKLDAHRRNVT